MDNNALAYGGKIDLEALDKDWSDPSNKWWMDRNADVEVLDIDIGDTSAEDDDFSVETIFADPDKKHSLVPEKRPLSWARTFMDDCFYHADRNTLLKWRGETYIWRRGAWRKASEDQIKKAVYLWGERCILTDASSGAEKGDFNPNISKVREIVAASSALCSIDDEIHQPSLLGPLDINPEMAVAMQNGIVDLRTQTMLPPSPRFFSASCNKFDFNADAPEPKEWLKFLDMVWGDDPQSIQCLQEIFGYMITSNTYMQKAFMVIGPPRSGKGTIARMLIELVGSDAAAAPTLAQLATNFGMAPLIGKKLALVADARLSPKTDTAMIAERILSVTGEDMQMMDRKNLSAWSGKLFSRFLILSNILPRFVDSSGALPSRMVILKMNKSFYGKEDTRLFDKLKSELPGVFLWALAGLKRLKDRGHFVVPDTGKALLSDMHDLASTMSKFVREECETGSEFQVERMALYEEWKMWCLNNGYKPGSTTSFKNDLSSVLPDLGEIRMRNSERRARFYTGIRLAVRSEKIVDESGQYDF